MTYTLVTLFLVGTTLLFWLYKMMCNCFCRSFCAWKDQKSGSLITKEATILSIKTIKEGRKPLLELLVVFENLSGFPIHRNVRVWDSKPFLSRFQTDDKISIALNKSRRPKDPVYLAVGTCDVSLFLLLACSIKIMVYVTGCYLLVGEALNRIWDAPDRFECAFSTSEIPEIFMILLAVVLLLHFLLKKIGWMETGLTRSQKWDLLYYGKGTSATIKECKDTGTKIRGGHVLHVTYVFEDERGHLFEGSDKKIVGALEKISLTEMDRLEIMYLPNNPFVSKLTENLETPDMSKFISALFLVVVFVFSAVVIGLFSHVVFAPTAVP
ncbi:hypothetical protein [Allomuricauda sp. M10]|uniref:hypothetical protein n=1 Tax=Allomuricauda sp. M10 TaxID=2683292 RepID=UPI001D18C333|nr:hypothetical protein [Muricauda sp. M10]